MARATTCVCQACCQEPSVLVLLTRRAPRLFSVMTLSKKSSVAMPTGVPAPLIALSLFVGVHSVSHRNWLVPNFRKVVYKCLSYVAVTNIHTYICIK